MSIATAGTEVEVRPLGPIGDITNLNILFFYWSKPFLSNSKLTNSTAVIWVKKRSRIETWFPSSHKGQQLLRVSGPTPPEPPAGSSCSSFSLSFLSAVGALTLVMQLEHSPHSVCRNPTVKLRIFRQGNPQMVLVTDFAVSDFSLRGPWKAVGAAEITPHWGPVRHTCAENTSQIRAQF